MRRPDRRAAVIEGTVAALLRDIQSLGKRSQPVRPAQRHPLRHAHGAHPFVPAERHSHQSRVVLQEPAVEVGVVRDDRGIPDERGDAWQHLVYGVRFGHRFVRDTGQLTNALGDVPRWTHEFVQHPFARDAILRLAADDRDLDDRIPLRTESGGLDVENAEPSRITVGVVPLDRTLDERAPPSANREVGRPVGIDILYADGSDAGHEADREQLSDLFGESH